MLTICNKLFKDLNNRNIRYCHWKSNSHLAKALLGKTDLDILVHSEDQFKFESILKKIFFKKILSPPRQKVPRVEGFFGF